jgi:hypothetical protein
MATDAREGRIAGLLLVGSADPKKPSNFPEYCLPAYQSSRQARTIPTGVAFAHSDSAGIGKNAKLLCRFVKFELGSL